MCHLLQCPVMELIRVFLDLTLTTRVLLSGPIMKSHLLLLCHTLHSTPWEGCSVATSEWKSIYLRSDILLWKLFKKNKTKKSLHNCCPKMWQAIIISGQQLSLSESRLFLEYDVVKIEWTHLFSFCFNFSASHNPKTLKSYTAAVITAT